MLDHPARPSRFVSTIVLTVLAAAAAMPPAAAAVLPGMRPAAGPRLPTGSHTEPLRVQSMAFYEGANENTDLPASFMAANYAWTEQGAGAQTADAFHNAGGAHAMQYTDSNARNCSSDKPGSCDDFLTLLNNLPEEAWLHEAGNSSVRVFGNGQQRNNPLDSAFQTAWTEQIDVLMNPSQGGSAAYTAAEGGSIELDTYNWQNLGTFTELGGPEYEITQNQQVVTAEVATVSRTPTYAVGNGVDYDYPQGGAYDAFLSQAGSALIGMFNENAFAVAYGSGYMTSAYPVTNAWQNQQDGVLDVIGRHKYDFVWMEGDPPPAHRLYGLASFWLTMDKTYSVLWEDFCAPDNTPKGLCNSTWDDAGIVPTHPRTTATTTIATLLVGALYVREFTRCYQGGVALGPCASVVNPGGSSAAWPILVGHYQRTIALPTTSLYGGGRVAWTTGLPPSIPAHGAAIVAGQP